MKKFKVSVLVLILFFAQCGNEQSPEQRSKDDSAISTPKKVNKDIKFTVQGLLNRPEALGIRPVKAEIYIPYCLI